MYYLLFHDAVQRERHELISCFVEDNGKVMSTYVFLSMLSYVNYDSTCGH